MNHISITKKELEELKDLSNQLTGLINRIEENQQPILEEKKKTKKVLKGLYLEPSINQAIDKATKDKQHGSRSQFVNDLLEQELRKNNLL